MNAERLHAIVIVLNQEMKETNSPGKLTALINALQQVINQNNAPNQQTLKQNLESMFKAVTDTPSDSFSPAWRQILTEIGGEALLGRSLKNSIETIFSQNQITLAVALQELQKLQSRLESFKNALEKCAESLKHFNIGDEKLTPGECEIGILIPRIAVDNKLLDFLDELKEFGFILNTFAEVVTGKKDDLSIRTISSSDLLIYLQAAAPYAAFVAICIERVVALYKNLLEIRKLRQDLFKQGVPDEAVSGIENHANRLMEEGINEIAEEMVNQYHNKEDNGRKNELINAVGISLNKIANRIDQGFNIEVRVAPITIPDGEEKEKDSENEELLQAITKIQSATANMQFMKLEGPPILRLPEKKEKPKK